MFVWEPAEKVWEINAKNNKIKKKYGNLEIETERKKEIERDIKMKLHSTADNFKDPEHYLL